MSRTPEVFLYTDGSCLGNPGAGGWAYILESCGNGTGVVSKNRSGSVSLTTNNRMELQAVVEGLSALKRPCRVRVCTDSRYVKDCLTKWIQKWRRNGWRTSGGRKPVKNRDLIMKLDELQHVHQVSWKWIRGHSGHPQNELCDQMARAAAEKILAEKAAERT